MFPVSNILNNTMSLSNSNHVIEKKSTHDKGTRAGMDKGTPRTAMPTQISKNLVQDFNKNYISCIS